MSTYLKLRNIKLVIFVRSGPIGFSVIFFTFKINKLWIDFIKRFPRYSKVVKNKSIKLCKFSCVRVEIFAVSFQTKPHSIIFTRSWVLMYITFAHGRTEGRTNRHFLKKFYFFLFIKNIYTCLSRLFFKFHPLDIFLTKVSIPFFSILEIRMKMVTLRSWSGAVLLQPIWRLCW